MIFKFVLSQKFGRGELLWTNRARVLRRTHTIFEVRAELVLSANILVAVSAVKHEPPDKQSVNYQNFKKYLIQPWVFWCLCRFHALSALYLQGGWHWKSPP